MRRPVLAGWLPSRLSLAALAIAGGLVALPGSAEGPPEIHPLVGYDFDAEEVATGPYTVMVFQDSRGRVTLSSRFRRSGTRSVEITDVPGDGDFAELQGFFPQRDEGIVAFRFSLLTTEAEESLNVALAGEAHFVLERDGIAFWLGTREGELFHHTAGRVEGLGPIVPFTWYDVDVLYRIDEGRYDLTVRQEGRADPIVELRDQPNAVGRPGSRVFKFSFIGDPPGRDRSAVRFYVDDIFVGTDVAVDQGEFVAPGRRRLFVDLWDYYRRELYRDPGCVPAVEPGDFGFSTADLRDLVAAEAVDRYTERAEGEWRGRPRTEVPQSRVEGLLHAMERWNLGCRTSADCRYPPCADDHFAAAAEWVPEARIYPMSRVFALAAAGDWDAADEIWLAIYDEWSDDPRFPAISARLGMLAEDYEWTEQRLAEIADPEPELAEDRLVRRLWSGRLTHELALSLAEAFPHRWRDMVRQALLAEHRYYVLLWQGKLAEASAYAAAAETRARRLGISVGPWVERQGDAAFRKGDDETARLAYERSLADHPDPTSVFLKLSDVHYRLGDFQGERSYREAVYGHLRGRDP